MDANQRLEFILKHTNNNPASFARAINNIAQTFYDIKNGKIKSISPEVADKIIAKYPEYNFKWLTTGKGEPFNETYQVNEPVIPYNTKEDDDFWNTGELEKEKYPDPIKKALQLKKKKGKESKDIPFVEIEAFVLPVKGRLGLGSTYYSDSYFENELSKVKLSIRDKPSNVKRFILAEFEGDSMTDGSENEILSDTWILLGERYRENWNDKMIGKIMGFYDRRNNFTVKRVKEHNQTFGTVILEALNPDKSDNDNKDRELEISDCWAVYEYIGKQDY